MRYEISQPTLPGRAVSADAGPGMLRTAARVAVAALLSFGLGWTCTIVWGIWTLRRLPEDQCRSHLRMLYVASRKVPNRTQQAPSLESVRGVLASTFLLTPANWGYLKPGSRASRPGSAGGYAGPELEALVCSLDPDYPYKIGRALAGSPAFDATYVWTPAPGLLAACPYHRLAVDATGRISRRTFVPGGPP